MLSCALCATLLLLSVVACDTSSNWRDDLSAVSVSNSVKAALPAEDGWEAVSDDYISPSAWGEDYADYLEKVDGYCIMVAENSDVKIDEVGVFLCKTEKDAKAIKTFAENYLATKKLQLTPLLESYNPEEIPKLEAAAVHTVGRYVLYTIADSADVAAAVAALEKALTPAE
jgi:hypothetical protein